MAIINQAKAWLSKKYPNANLSDSETLIKFLNEVKGVRLQNQKDSKIPSLNNSAKCPSCKTEMIRVRLCGSCDLFNTKDQWKSMEICPVSIGTLQKANTMAIAKKDEKKYSDYLLLMGIEPKPITCNQKGILTKEHSD